MEKFKLLIHHHSLAYQDPQKNIHISSFIGRWVNALADHVGEIRLLLYQSDTLLPLQDEVINKSKVSLWSLGPPGRMWDRIPRMRRLRQVCQQASVGADGLLIRGITPRQMSIWNHVKVSRKAFLLVGSLFQTQPVLKLRFWGIYEALMRRWRNIEVLRMAKSGVLMANSPDLVNELATLNCVASFVPTNSISLNELAPFRVHAFSNPHKILFCGRVVLEKGIKELIQAVAQVNKNRPCILDIVGPVELSFQRELNHLIFELGLTDNIQWHGQIPYGEQLMTFYQQADVLVLPTYYEGFPHVIWEAAANCCPTITTRVGGIPSLWKDGEHGILISPKNSEEIVQALETLFTDNILHAGLVKNAYALSEKYVVEECAVQLISVLHNYAWNL